MTKIKECESYIQCEIKLGPHIVVQWLFVIKAPHFRKSFNRVDAGQKIIDASFVNSSYSIIDVLRDTWHVLVTEIS